MKELRKKQLYLDAFIDVNYKIDEHDRFEFKVSWLLTEVAELANDDAWFKYCKEKDQLAYRKRYEEASDCLHLFISLANELGVEIVEPITRLCEEDTFDFRYRSQCYKNTLKHISFIGCNNSVYENSIALLNGFDSYLCLITSMGLSWQHIKRAYNDKNVKNLKLQMLNMR